MRAIYPAAPETMRSANGAEVRTVRVPAATLTRGTRLAVMTAPGVVESRKVYRVDVSGESVTVTLYGPEGRQVFYRATSPAVIVLDAPPALAPWWEVTDADGRVVDLVYAETLDGAVRRAERGLSAAVAERFRFRFRQLREDEV